MRNLRPAREQQLLVFSLAGMACALPLSDVCEVVPMAQLSTPPGLPAILDGFLNLRGTLVPVVRLACLFDLPLPVPTLDTPLLIVRGPESSLGLRVEAVREVLSVDATGMTQMAPGNVFNDCAIGQVGFAEMAIHLLSTERLLLEKERKIVARWQAELQSRLDETCDGAHAL
jgi:purine-binding chemotaxis protein CheW